MIRSRHVRRRTVLRAAAGALAAAGAPAVAGCSTADRAVQVAVVWSGDELRLFQRVVAGYRDPVQVISAGDDIDAFLRARHLAGTSPDVAILPRPGLVTDYARRGWLTPLDPGLARRFPAELGDLLRDGDNLYGAWVKAAHKSLFWYFPSMLPQPPRSWDDLVTLTRTLGRTTGRGRRPAPLSIGAADGWVLTDWFENVLADTAPVGTYDALANGEADWQAPDVHIALDRLAEIWSIDGAFPGGGRRALLTQNEESVIQVVTTRRAAMVFEGDFVEQVDRSFHQGPEQLATFRFPGTEPGAGPVVVGGDAAVALRGSRTGSQLVEWLTRPDTFRPWLDAGGYLSPNVDVAPDSYRDPWRRQLAADLRGSTSLRFDLSDRLPAPFTGSDGVGIWRIMQEFFADVTGGRLGGAVDRATGQLARAARDAGGGW